MYLEYLFIELVLLIAAAGLLLSLIRAFTANKTVIATALFPLLTFVGGFSLRLTGINEMVDIGFFFTDMSFLFVYLVFAVALLPGQVKYWRKG